VHPAADVFPVLDDDELEALANDIKANGLQQPLIVAEVNGQMMLIDGRTRRMAYLALGIIPDYVLLDGQDPLSYILSANIHRRHMTKGQRAMAVAKIYPEPQKLKRKDSSSLEIKELNSGYVSHARIVLQHAPDLADAGTTKIHAFLHAKQYIPLYFNWSKNGLVFPMSTGTERDCPS
jgi:hypothetical protein